MTNPNDTAYPYEAQDSCGNSINRESGLTKREELLFRVYASMCQDLTIGDHPWVEIAGNASKATDALFAALNATSTKEPQ